MLQRIAVCYLVAAAAYRMTAGNRRRQAVTLGVVAATLALGYWGIMMLVPPPGGVAGDLTPEGNLGAWIDRALMDGHLWRPRRDPERLLGTVPAVATTLFGVLAGLCLGTGWTAGRKAGILAAGGAAAVAIGLLWGLVFPINKPLWTSSYAVLTAGCGPLLLAFLYWAIDMRGWRRWTTPLVILGLNAITLYVASGLLAKTLGVIRVAAADGRDLALSGWIYVNAFAPYFAPKNASLTYAVANLVVLFVLLWWMYSRRLFLRV